jgi:hypothetical protein
VTGVGHKRPVHKYMALNSCNHGRRLHNGHQYICSNSAFE